jgi:integrase
MPAEQRGQPYRLGRGRWGLRYYDRDNVRRRTKEKFPSRTAALNHYRDVVEPMLRGERPKIDHTLATFAPVFLERHGAGVRSRTIGTLRDRLGVPKEGSEPRNAVAAFGDIPLRELERMVDEIAAWQAKQPARVRHGRVQALRQCLDAAKRWGHMDSNPSKLAGPNPKTPRRRIRPYTRAELDAIGAEMSPAYRMLPQFGAATGLRPEEWSVLERADIDRRNGVLNVRRTLSDGEVVELAKTNRSRRQVPLTRRALAALDQIPPRLHTPVLYPAPQGGVLNLDNWRRREWAPAVTASGVAKPARPYDMRSTYASESIAAGVGSDELARVMGTSVAMIEEHYGVLLGGAIAAIAARQDAHDAAQDHHDQQEER